MAKNTDTATHMPPGRRRTRTDEPQTTFRLWRSLGLGVILLALLVAGYEALAHFGLLEIVADRTALERWIADLGVFGPIAIIGTMTVAIVFSPIPSAPIALVSGAMFGHGWGSLYVLVGSTLGASTAFLIARTLGYGILRRWFGDRLNQGLLGSQNGLMAIVFVSRLLPFLSFDIVSYAVGLSPLTYWRFAVATIAGIAPASFLLGHFGSELVTGEASRIAGTVLALGALTLIPLGVGLWRKRATERQSQNH